ncbi:MAG: hypothetical protein V2A64_01075 [Candidatus Omnitrophota bacterium]
MKKENYFCLVLIGLCLLFSQHSFAATTKAMVVYALNGSPGIPAYKLWNGFTWGTEKYALFVGANPIKWIVLKQCPIRNEYILGTMDSAGVIKAQVYNVAADNWGNLQTIATASTSACRGFDIAYEFDSGEALVVANNNTAKPVYWSWNGGTSVWSNGGSINVTTTGMPVWIRLKPWSGATGMQGGDCIMLGLLDTNKNLYYVIWRGTSWETTTKLQISATYLAYSYSYEAMDVLAYYCKEPNFRDVSLKGYAYAMARWGETLVSNKYRLLYNEFKVNPASGWGGVGNTSSPVTSGSSVHYYWVRANNCMPKKNVMSYVDSIVGAVDSTGKLHVQLFKEVAGAGLGFVSAANIGTVPATGSRAFDTGVETSQAAGLIVWGASGSNTLQYRICNITSATIGSTTSGPIVGAAGITPNIVVLTGDTESDDMFLATVNSSNVIYVTKWDGNSNSWGTPIQITAFTSGTTGEPVAVAFQQYNPPPELTQNNYRWYVNTDAVQPVTGLAGENTAVTVAEGTIVRLRVNMGVTVADFTSPQKFILQFTTTPLLPSSWKRLSPLGTGKFWSCQTPDTTAGANFTMAEIAVDSSGSPHIGYSDATNLRMKYTYWTGSAWGSKTNPDSPETIGTYSTFADTGPNIVLDSSNNPQLAYCCLADGDTNRDLGYAKWNGSSWNLLYRLDSNSKSGTSFSGRVAMCLDSSGNAHFSYRDNSIAGYIKYTGAWSTAVYLDSLNSASQETTAMVIDSANNIHVIYDDNVGATTRYTKWTGSAWTTPISICNVRSYCSIDVDKDNHPHAMITGYYHVWYNGVSWSNEDLSGLLYPSGAGISKPCGSIRIDRTTDNIHLVYTYKDDNTPKKRGVRYAWYDGIWHSEIIEETYGDSDSYYLRPRAFDRDSDGVPHVAYARTIDGIAKIRYATKIDPSGFRGYDNSVPADGDTITGCLLTGSTIRENYEETTSYSAMPAMPNAISVGAYGEWDWVVKIEGAAAGTTYYFRMVKDNDDALDAYTRYPELTISSGISRKAKMTHWEEVR